MHRIKDELCRFLLPTGDLVIDLPTGMLLLADWNTPAWDEVHPISMLREPLILANPGQLFSWLLHMPHVAKFSPANLELKGHFLETDHKPILCFGP